MNNPGWVKPYIDSSIRRNLERCPGHAGRFYVEWTDADDCWIVHAKYDEQFAHIESPSGAITLRTKFPDGMDVDIVFNMDGQIEFLASGNRIAKEMKTA